MKKSLVLALALALIAGATAFAERTFSLGLGYAMNNSSFEFTGVPADFAMNGLCLGLDTSNSIGNLPVSFFSSSVLYIPGQLDVSMLGMTLSRNEFDIAFCGDFCFGAGYTLKIGSPFAIFAGLGLALDMSALQKNSWSFIMMNMGVGANVSARFMFTKNFGINVTVRDNWCPLMIVGGENAEDYSKDFRSQNVFNVSGGVTFVY